MKKILKRFLLPVIFGILAAAVLLPLQPATPVNAQEGELECWAIIVGVSDYQYLNDLSWADDDARDLADQLSPVWGSDHVKLLVNSAATKAGIMSAITDWLAPKEVGNDVVLFYWSGYRNDSSGYLYPYNSSTFSMLNDIHVDELNSWLAYLDSKKIVIMNVGGDKHLDALSRTGRIILTPNAAGEPSWSTSDLGHSVFTYYILEALDKFEAADSNSNSELSAEEIFNYAKSKTTDYSVSSSVITTQHPQMSDGCEGDVNLLIQVTADVKIDTTATNILSIDGQPYSSSSLPKTFVWAPGSQHTLTTTSIISGTSGTRYVFNSWNDGNTSNSRSISLGGAYTASYETQYYLTVNSDYVVPSGAGWYDSDSTATIQVASVVEQAGTKRIFTGWVGDFSGNTATASVLMNQPKTVTASWKTQYYLTVTSVRGNPSGAGWYDSGSTAAISVDALVEETGTKHHFNGWSGDYSGNTASASVVMNQPKAATAEWSTEYLLTVISEFGEPQGGGWYDSGKTAAISVTTPVGMIIRQVFTGWTGDYSGNMASDSVVMNQPKTVTAQWTTDSLQLYILIIGVVIILGGGLGGFLFIKARKRKMLAPVVETTQSPPSPARCANCGAEIAPGDKFCIKCGKSANDN